MSELCLFVNDMSNFLFGSEGTQVFIHSLRLVSFLCHPVPCATGQIFFLSVLFKSQRCSTLGVEPFCGKVSLVTQKPRASLFIPMWKVNPGTFSSRSAASPKTVIRVNLCITALGFQSSLCFCFLGIIDTFLHIQLYVLKYYILVNIFLRKGRFSYLARNGRHH